jgi:hypothetical protein
MWPVLSYMWGLHDFTTGSAQNGNNYVSKIRQYGDFTTTEQFVKQAQFVNYETHKALFEGPETSKGNAMLMWMSQSAWPSMVWQTYDYYFDTNAGYFGIKAANQNVNALYNQNSRQIVIANNSGKQYNGLTLEVDTYNLYGVKQGATKTYSFNLAPDEVITNPAGVGSPVVASSSTSVNFIQTRVKDSSDKVISENFYWVTTASGRDFTDLGKLEEVRLITDCKTRVENGTYFVDAEISNDGDAPALLIRVKTLTDATGRQVLPAYYSDNYFSLMPGQSKTITIEFDEKYTFGENPAFFIEGWNVKSASFDEDRSAYVVRSLRFKRGGEYSDSVDVGAVSLEASIKAYDDAPAGMTAILAVYKDGTLDSATAAPFGAISAGQTITVETQAADIPYSDLEKYSVKGFLWDGEKTPAAASVSLGQWSPGANPNLALQRHAVASSYDGDNPMANVNDGGGSSYWQNQSNNTGDEWIYVDLGFVADVEKVVIQTGSPFPASYLIQAATEAGSFETVRLAAGSANAALTEVFSPTVSARYIRLYFTSGTNGYKARIFEIEVYGKELYEGEIRLIQPYDAETQTGAAISVKAQTYGYTGTGIVVSAVSLPDGANFDPETKTFSWRPVQVGTYPVTLKADNGISADQKTFYITVKPVNLALKKNAYAIDSDNASRSADKAVDGDYGGQSRWASNSANNKWWYVDLGADYVISSVVIYWEAARANSFRLDFATAAQGAGRNFTTTGLTGTPNGDTYNGAPGTQIITFAEPVTARYVQFYGLTRATQYGFSFYEFEVYGQQNLAVGKTVTASSENTDRDVTQYARYATDGDLGTRWSSDWNDNEWLTVDLGYEQDVSKAVIRWEASYGTSYRIDTAPESGVFSTATTVTNGQGGTETITFDTARARYVRFHGLSRATIGSSKYGFSIWEFEVYEK